MEVGWMWMAVFMEDGGFEMGGETWLGDIWSGRKGVALLRLFAWLECRRVDFIGL